MKIKDVLKRISKQPFLGIILFILILGIYFYNKSPVLINISKNILLKIGGVTPDPIFLSDIAAFEAAIIAFLIPLSIEIISKISERYNSDIITRSFENNWENRVLPSFILINVVIAIILRFLIQDDVNSTLWKILAWVVLLTFIYIAFAIWRVINRIKTFMSNTRSVVEKLYEDIEKSIK